MSTDFSPWVMTVLYRFAFVGMYIFFFLFKWWRIRNISSSCHICFNSCVKWHHESLQDPLTQLRTFDQSMTCCHSLNTEAYIVIRSARRKQRSGCDVSLWNYMRHMHDFCTDITCMSLSLRTRWMKLHMKENIHACKRLVSVYSSVFGNMRDAHSEQWGFRHN